MNPPTMQDIQLPLWLEKISFGELRAGGYIDLSGTFRNELADNPRAIHPLFYQRQWLGVPTEDYVLLMPALQLATKLLTSPRFLVFWEAVLRRRRHIRTDGLRVMYGRLCDRVDLSHRHLNEVEERWILNVLLNLKNVHRFKFQEEFNLCDADATTDLVAHPGFGSYRTHASVSRISDEYLRLLRLFNQHEVPACGGIPSRWDRPTRGSILRTSFHLAKTLVHELCHALNNAIIPLCRGHPNPEIGIKIEPFFMDQNRCELGRAWESLVFGGHIDGIGDGLSMQFGLSVTKWPHPFSQEGEERAPSRRLFTTSYAIPMAWVEALWTNDFWYHVDHCLGFDFRIPKILGIRKATNVVWTEEDEEYECFSSTDDSEVAEMGNEERAEALGKRMRVRVRYQLGLEGEYDDSEDSSVARHEDWQGVIRDGGMADDGDDEDLPWMTASTGAAPRLT
ncbi:uncharacterized protein BKCO1_15000123 [Diplodia corticola]|uniref:Uncharacterized protein n=1 Tax=Diplodia corticola TaxID=236234 RepID=A0A1J9RT56_9PEZI|nr:uncharacterized protein BKCO1_15000123 [Diplodia corticola]OJD35731.1 hypothetical protein BKCO1_15000123 [Diplodia corticola]